MNKILLLSFFLSLHSWASVVGVSTNPLSEDQKLITAEMSGYMSQRREMGAGLRYTQQVDETRVLDAAVSGAQNSRGFAFGAGVDFELLHEEIERPRVSLKSFFLQENFERTNSTLVGLAPTIRKNLSFSGLEVFPYLALPNGIKINNQTSEFVYSSAMTLGASLPFPGAQNDRVILTSKEIRILEPTPTTSRLSSPGCGTSMIYFSDFDGTLTTKGELTRDFFEIMDLIKHKSHELVIVSGRSLSWGHFFLTHFPLRACIMEGGGVIVYRDERGEIVEEPLVSQDELRRLEAFTEKLKHHYPHVPLSADSFGRLSDRAIEFHLMEERWVEEVMDFMKKEKINFSKSNVHINFWCGNISKYLGVVHFLKNYRSGLQGRRTAGFSETHPMTRACSNSSITPWV